MRWSWIITFWGWCVKGICHIIPTNKIRFHSTKEKTNAKTFKSFLLEKGNFFFHFFLHFSSSLCFHILFLSLIRLNPRLQPLQHPTNQEWFVRFVPIVIRQFPFLLPVAGLNPLRATLWISSSTSIHSSICLFSFEFISLSISIPFCSVYIFSEMSNIPTQTLYKTNFDSLVHKSYFSLSHFLSLRENISHCSFGYVFFFWKKKIFGYSEMFWSLVHPYIFTSPSPPPLP